MARIAFAVDASGARVLSGREDVRALSIVSGSGEATLELERLGLESRSIDELFDFDWIDQINSLSAGLARSWLREAAAGSSDPERVAAVQRMVELPVHHVVSEAVRSILLARRLLRESAAEGVLVAGVAEFPRPDYWVGFWLSLKGQALAHAAAQEGLPVEYLREPAAPPVAGPVLLRVARRLHASVRWRLGAPARRRRARRRAMPPAPLPEPGDRPVVLVYAEGRHVYPLLPVLERLVRTSRYSPVLLDQDLAPGARQPADQLRLPLADPRAADPEPTEIHLPFGADALAGAKRAFSDAGEQHLGVSLWPLVRFQIEWLLGDGAHEALRRLALAEATVSRLRPAILLTPVASSVNDLAWVVAARRASVPVVVQLHGAMYRDPSPNDWSRGEGDITAVWGAATRDWHLQSTGRAASAYPCVGYPRLDEVAAAASAEAGEAKRRLGLTDCRVVLFLVSMATGAIGSYFRSQMRVYETFFAALRRFDDVTTLVRVHPASDVRAAAAAVARAGPRARLAQEDELLPLIEAADVVVGQPTTALLEAMAFGRPVIHFGAEMSDRLLWWTRYGDLSVAADADRLELLLRRFLDDPSSVAAARDAQNAFLDRYAGPRDGRAAERTVAILESLYPA